MAFHAQSRADRRRSLYGAHTVYRGADCTKFNYVQMQWKPYSVISSDTHTSTLYTKPIRYLSGMFFLPFILPLSSPLPSSLPSQIADFGMSRVTTESGYYVTRGGQIPVKWTAPEAILFRKYSTSSDVWSLGMVLFEVWSLGWKPFDNFNIDQVRMHEVN